mmetsp:Transcript_3568/g.9651  ORF Transcript_3568/g.9651 Transcript_3568/m.9651 type:complete len:225 (+) Transcript_3568:1225-1899(+)
MLRAFNDVSLERLSGKSCSSLKLTSRKRRLFMLPSSSESSWSLQQAMESFASCPMPSSARGMRVNSFSDRNRSTMGRLANDSGRSLSWLFARYICCSTGELPSDDGSSFSLLNDALSTPRLPGTMPSAIQDIWLKLAFRMTKFSNDKMFVSNSVHLLLRTSATYTACRSWCAASKASDDAQPLKSRIPVLAASLIRCSTDNPFAALLLLSKSGSASASSAPVSG